MGQYMSLSTKHKTLDVSKYIYSLAYMTNTDVITIHSQTGQKAQSVNLLPYKFKHWSLGSQNSSVFPSVIREVTSRILKVQRQLT